MKTTVEPVEASGRDGPAISPSNDRPSTGRRPTGRIITGSTVIVCLILVASVFVKGFYLANNRNSIGPDASEYISYVEIIKDQGAAFVASNNNLTFWRLPLLPLMVSLCPSLEAFYVVQLLLSYVLGFWLYRVLQRLLNDEGVSRSAALGSLFLPYLNIAACSLLTEFMQVFLIMYVLKKIVYQQYDPRLTLALTALCLLRQEAYLGIPWVVLAFVAPLGWMSRNLVLFGSFSLVNPILASRALIGSVHQVISVSEPHEFHRHYDYRRGFEFDAAREFVTTYRRVVWETMVSYISQHPLEYLGRRMYAVTKAFSYVSFNMERLPDVNWDFVKNPTWEQAATINAYWSYSNLIARGDVMRLLIRILYNGSLATIHLFGLFQMMRDYKIAKPVAGMSRSLLNLRTE